MEFPICLLNYIKLGGMTNTQGGCVVIQRDLQIGERDQQEPHVIQKMEVQNPAPGKE